jgi:hypothetical protein
MAFDPSTKYKIGDKISLDGHRYVCWSACALGLYLRPVEDNSAKAEQVGAYWKKHLEGGPPQRDNVIRTNQSQPIPPNPALTQWVSSILNSTSDKTSLGDIL